MSEGIRELNRVELGQIAGGAPIPLGGSPEMGIGGGSGGVPSDPGNPFVGLDPAGDPKSPFIPIGPGGRDWWTLPGDPTPVLPILKPDPGKP
jgi:hypothetical protein